MLRNRQTKQMKNKPGCIILYILLSVCFLYSTSCVNGNSVSVELNKARLLMDTASDSSLAILNRISHPEALPEHEYAAYCLLLTQAMDKSLYIHTSDSLIMIATNYYEKHHDPEALAQSYYYTGRVYSDMQETLNAQQYFLKALDLGEDLDMPELLIRVYNSLGTLYSYQDVYEMALPLYKKALPLLENTSDSTNLSYVLRNIARVFAETQHPDSAILYFHQAINVATPQSISALQNGLGSLYLQTGKYADAYNCIQNAIRLCKNPKRLDPIYLNLGEYYFKTAQYDSARHYLNYSLQSPVLYTKAGSLYFLAQIEKQKRDFKNYLKYWDEYEKLRDSINNILHFENIRMTQNMFNYQRIADEKIKYEHESARRMIIIYQLLIITAILTTLSFFYFRKEEQKKRKILDLKDKLYKQSLQYIEDNKKKISLLEEELNSGQKTLSETSRKLYETQKKLYILKNNQITLERDTMQQLKEDLKKTSLFAKINQTEEKLSEDEWSELCSLVDATYPNFTKCIYDLYARISAEELRICYLVKIGTSVKRIATLINKTSSGVSQCRRRLYKKLTKEMGNAEKFDSFIADL